MYYLNLRTSGAVLLDPEGSEATSLEAARMEAIAAIREIVANDVLTGGVDLRCSIQICDAEGLTLTEVPCREAVSFVDWGVRRDVIG